MDLGVRDRGFLVFGGSKGMGLAAARTLAADGARVAVVGRDAAAAKDAAASLGPGAVALSGDLTVAGESERLVEEAVAALGDLRGMAVTTGLGARAQKELLTGTDEDWAASFDDILLATVRACRATVPHLVEAGGGSIVTTSAYSIRAPKSYQFPYAALKAAVANVTKNVAKAFGRAGVRANCVCPGAPRPTPSPACARGSPRSGGGTSTRRSSG